MNSIDRAFTNGVAEGRRQMKRAVLTMLETKYNDPSIIRGSIDGNALLDLLRTVSNDIELVAK